MSNGEQGGTGEFTGRTLPSLFFEGIGDLFSTMGTGVSEAVAGRPRLIVDNEGRIRYVTPSDPLHPSNRYVPGPIPLPVDIDRAVRAAEEAQGIPPGQSRFRTGGPVDLSGLFAGADGAGPGYAPSLVDTAAAEALLRYEQTPEERAALEQLIQDLEFRAEAGTAAVRTGWQDVQAINSAAANKAAQMARAAGPEAARLWIDAANNALTLSAQAAEVLGTTPGMQTVNISPTAGSERIAALLAAQAPRAQALAERMGLASAEEIAAQARTAAMMGEAYAGDIQRTALIQANQARQAHNQQVLARISQERQLGAQMRFNAAQTNAQLLSQAAAQAASGATSSEQRAGRIRQLVADVREFANIDPQNVEPRNGIAALMGIYGLDADTARGLILGARQGTLDWAGLMANIEG